MTSSQSHQINNQLHVEIPENTLSHPLYLNCTPENPNTITIPCPNSFKSTLHYIQLDRLQSVSQGRS
ncbi:hypothetical protein BDV23DRAFT_31563 [Aspergillus alliaceus]|uniref:Uncharacterized protein n=1 Tax=Petromyces alliaceus TaxID=209559 RepID=A0A5N6FMD9_PETAA|nr:uncharacterized protein BDW43DRAFT_143814 [Aspergillus alliaceus]KAB8231028.1 hypothetical protein BDW43DRAFT_143814 [Aspergillus alliaceus]KAE8384635.1 hypothetical protein BDV23DRAFT_31563 [Aspergillus alliaceus]